MTKRIGVVFPGYGEQFVGMGKELYDEYRVVQEFFEQATSVANKNFVKLLFASSREEISSTRYAYLAIFLLEASLYQVLFDKGLRPDFVSGYGIGEYAACFASQSLSLVDGLYFLNKYSQFYQEFVQDKEYAVLKITRGFSLEAMQKLVDEISSDNKSLFIAAHNSLEGFYLAGLKDAIEEVKEYCKQHTIRKVKDLTVEYGLHSELMNSLVKQISLYYHKIKFKELKVPVITNVDATYVTTSEALQSAVMRRVNNKINWYEVSQGFEGCDVIISVGPGKQLVEWFQEMYPNKEYHVIRSLADIEQISSLFEKEVIPFDKKKLADADKKNEKSSDYDIDNDEG